MFEMLLLIQCTSIIYIMGVKFNVILLQSCIIRLQGAISTYIYKALDRLRNETTFYYTDVFNIDVIC